MNWPETAREKYLERANFQTTTKYNKEKRLQQSQIEL